MGGIFAKMENDVVNEAMDWYKEAKRVNELGWSDVDKHRYVSCRAGQKGNGISAIGFGAGVAKETIDFYIKTLTPSQRARYGGIGGIAKDGIKDMGNNAVGLRYGRENPNGDCLNITKRQKLIK